MNKNNYPLYNPMMEYNRNPNYYPNTQNCNYISGFCPPSCNCCMMPPVMLCPQVPTSTTGPTGSISTGVYGRASRSNNAGGTYDPNNYIPSPSFVIEYNFKVNYDESTRSFTAAPGIYLASVSMFASERKTSNSSIGWFVNNLQTGSIPVQPNQLNSVTFFLYETEEFVFNIRSLTGSIVLPDIYADDPVAMIANITITQIVDFEYPID